MAEKVLASRALIVPEYQDSLASIHSPKSQRVFDGRAVAELRMREAELLGVNSRILESILPSKDLALTKAFDRFTHQERSLLRRPFEWYNQASLDGSALSGLLKMIKDDREVSMLVVNKPKVAQFEVGIKVILDERSGKVYYPNMKDGLNAIRRGEPGVGWLDHNLTFAHIAMRSFEVAAIEATLRQRYLLELPTQPQHKGVHDAAIWFNTAQILLGDPRFERIIRLRDERGRSAEEIAKLTVARGSQKH